MRDVAEILAEAGLPTAVAEPLDGGFSNETYRVTGGPVDAVLRLNGHQNDTLGLSRAGETAAIRAAAARGIAPQVLAAGDDYLLTALVPGALLTPEQSREPRYIRELARVLTEVHAIDGVSRPCDPFWLVRTYLDGARRLGIPMPDGLDGVLREVDAIEARAAARGDGGAYCHNDFYRFNVIDDDGRLTVLDWELSGVGNVYFDLATPAFHQGYTVAEDRLLIEAYFGEFDDRPRCTTSSTSTWSGRSGGGSFTPASMPPARTPRMSTTRSTTRSQPCGSSGASWQAMSRRVTPRGY